VTRQAAQPRLARPQIGQRLDHVETRQLDVLDQRGVTAPHRSTDPLGKRTRVMKTGDPFDFDGIDHDRIVGDEPLAKEDNEPEKPVAIDSNRCHPLTEEALQAAVIDACRDAKLNDSEAAKLMGMSPSQWSRQLRGADGHYIQLQRQAKLPAAFWLSFVTRVGGLLGCSVSQPDHEASELSELLTLCARVVSRRMLKAELQPVVVRRRA
jgi:hypothetical protein